MIYFCMFRGRKTHLIYYSFYYSNITLMYFLRKVFPSNVSSLISLKIVYCVTGLINCLSRIFEFWRVNAKKIVNIWCHPPTFIPTLHLSYLVKHSPHYWNFIKPSTPPTPYLPICKCGVLTMLCLIRYFKEGKQVISPNKPIGLYVQFPPLGLVFLFSFFLLIVYNSPDWFLHGAVVVNLIN